VTVTHLSALPLAVPFLAGPVLVAVGWFAPRVFNDTLSMLSALAVTTLCVLLAVHAGRRTY
jgi:small neutral amino acid transporter SnatA (MarC family)